MENQNQTFQQWGVLEIMGNQKFAGFVEEESVLGEPRIKLTVPTISHEGKTVQGFQKYFGKSSLYAFTPTTEDYAKSLALILDKEPIEGYDHQRAINQIAQQHFENLKHEEVKKLAVAYSQNPELMQINQ